MRNDRPAIPAVALAIAVAGLLAACGGDVEASTPPGGGSTSQPDGGDRPTGAPVTDLTKLCDLLGPGDFEAVGIASTGVPTVSSDGPGSAYCSYTGAPAANGGVEFDVFVNDAAAGTFQTILGDIGSVAPAEMPGVDEAAASDGIAGLPDRPASIVVRKGKLVFTIAAPGGPNNSLMLEQLAELVLARGAGLAG